MQYFCIFLNLADGRKTEERSCLTMEDNKNTTQGTNTANVPTNEDKNAGNKTFSQADMDNLAGKIRGEEKAKNTVEQASL